MAHGVPLDGRACHVVEGEGGVDVVDAVQHLVEAQVVRQPDPWKTGGMMVGNTECCSIKSVLPENLTEILMRTATNADKNLFYGTPLIFYLIENHNEVLPENRFYVTALWAPWII